MFTFCSMSCQPEKRARAEAMLGELAELGLMVARELAVRTRESEDVDQTVALAGAFQKVSRVVRLTLALDFKLERDAAREARAEAREAEAAEALAAERREAAAPPAVPTPVEARKSRVRSLLSRLLWNECEGDSEEFEILSDDLTARLDEAALGDEFETLPIEAVAGRMIADMGLSGDLTLSLGETPARDTPQRTPEPADTG
jgi:hypothetical protein